MTLDEILAELAQCQPLSRTGQTTKGKGMTMDDHNTANDLRRIIGDTITELGRVKAERDELAAALVEAMEWINNWDADFKNDPEWPTTEIKVRAALAKLKKGEA